MNNWQNIAKQENSWGGRYRRPQTGLAVCARKNLLQRVHRFCAVDSGAVSVKGTEPLVKSDMSAVLPPSLPFAQVASASHRAPY